MSSTPSTLRVRARGTAKQPDFERMDAGILAHIGRKYGEVTPGQWGSVPTEEAVTIPSRAEYIKAVRDGDLWAADEATAKACGVDFDPHFGAPAPAPPPPPPPPPAPPPHVDIVDEPSPDHRDADGAADDEPADSSAEKG